MIEEYKNSKFILIPCSEGGKILPDNPQMLCKDCNGKKGRK
jgi:hypothetical protein